MKEFNHIDITERPGLPRWKLELEARFSHEDNKINYPELMHVPYSVTPEAVIEPEHSDPDEAIVHFIVPNSVPLRSQRLIFYK